MNRALWFLASALTLGLAWRWRCRGQHDTERDPATGGRRCKTCKRPFPDMAASGELDGSGHVSPTRVTYERGRNGGVTRTSW